MSRWFRFYADAHRNEKVASLSDKHFRLWTRLLSVAAENDGQIPPLERLSRVLNVRLDHLSTGVEALANISLIDRSESGYRPHSWDKFQYKSDTSTKRVTAFRRSKVPHVETGPETETDTELPLPDGSGAAPIENLDENARFWANAKSFLTRQGKTQAEAGKLIGKWVKASTRDNVAKILGAAQANPPADIVAYIEGAIRNGKSNGGEFWTISGDPHSGIPL